MSSSKNAPVVVTSLQDLSEAMPETKHDVSSIVEAMLNAPKFAVFAVKQAKIQVARAKAAGLFDEARVLMNAPEFAELKANVQQNAALVEQVVADTEARIKQTQDTPAIKDLLSAMYHNGMQKEFKAELRKQAELETASIMADNLALIEEFKAEIKRLEVICSANRKAADRLGRRGRMLFAASKSVANAYGLKLDSRPA
jgi:hypothetical protein